MAKHIWMAAGVLVCSQAVCTAFLIWALSNRVAVIIATQNEAIDRAAMWQRDQFEEQVMCIPSTNRLSLDEFDSQMRLIKKLIDNDIGDRPSNYTPPDRRQMFNWREH